MDYVIIVAGGKGTRMGTDTPKQFLPVGGVPVLMRTIMRFNDYDKNLRIILVLPRDQQHYWHQLCYSYHFDTHLVIADGGATRFHSVLNGLNLIPDDAEGIVGVHDGVRPFVTKEVIGRCYEAARSFGAAVPVTAVTETLRHVNGNASITAPRNEYRMVQTPQAFDIRLLKKAYMQPYRETFTDDASVVESMGKQITLIDGNRENIKITTPFDITIAEALLAH